VGPRPSTNSSVPAARGYFLKVAFTDLLPFIRRVVGLARPESAPDQPPNLNPEPGTAVSVTTVPAG
jgi:hypothetical protein